LMRPHAVHTDAEHFRVQCLERLHLVHKTRVLVGARGTPIQRVPHQHHFLFVLILQREIRRFLPNRNTHSVSSMPLKVATHLTESAARATNGWLPGRDALLVHRTVHRFPSPEHGSTLCLRSHSWPPNHAALR